MTPIEFTLWLNGAAGILGDSPPTAEQWAAMREKLDETVGKIVAARLLEVAEEAQRSAEKKRELEAARSQLMQGMAAQKSALLAQQLDRHVFDVLTNRITAAESVCRPTLSRVATYAATVDEAGESAASVRSRALDMLAGIRRGTAE